MKKIFLSVSTMLMIGLVFSACSAKEQKMQEPYYDRANTAAQDAHNRLNKD